MNRIPRILIVDDEPEVCDLIQSILNSLGYQCETASDGIEALAKMKLDVDLVLSDVWMPGMDGFEVVKKIRGNSETADIPVIMITSMDNRQYRLRAVEAGANDFITKPLDRTELQVRIASLLRFKDAHDELKRHKAELEYMVERRTEHLRKALKEVVEANRSTQKAYLETIQRLAIVAEYKDANTAAHIKRIGDYCVLFAKSLSLPPHTIETILYAAPMHDIGKIGIPDEVLLKPGKLNLEERVIIEGHPEWGKKLLTGSDNELLNVSEVIAMSHHEKWDGSGYPLGLKGDRIPLFGRICALADVFDALTSERPYKPRFSNQEAFRIIREGSNAHFDPFLVDLFFDVIDEVQDIQKKY